MPINSEYLICPKLKIDCSADPGLSEGNSTTIDNGDLLSSNVGEIMNNSDIFTPRYTYTLQVDGIFDSNASQVPLKVHKVSMDGIDDAILDVYHYNPSSETLLFMDTLSSSDDIYVANINSTASIYALVYTPQSLI